MMTEKTGLEKQEEEVSNLIFGKPTSIGATDKSMLEMTDTNRLIINARQSELQIACNLLHASLYAEENKKPEYKRVRDSQGQWKTERAYHDHWKWLQDFDHIVRTNQLTIKGFSRAQHLRQQASMSAIAVEEEQQSFWQRLFGK
jgi:hypothetical protein